MAQVIPVEVLSIEEQPWSDPNWAGDVSLDESLSVRSCCDENWDNCPLWIWEMPVPFSVYTIAIDPSSGMKNCDPASIQVVNMNGSQVAEMTLVSADIQKQFKSAMALGYFYNQAKMVVEINGVGEYLAKIFDIHKYPNMYIERGIEIGWRTTVRTRSLMIEKMRKALIDKYPILKSKRLKNELLAFIQDCKAEDDLIMAMMIAYQCK